MRDLAFALGLRRGRQSSPRHSRAGLRRTLALTLVILACLTVTDARAVRQSPADEARRLEQEASKLAAEGKFKDGIASAQKAIAIREAAVGRDDPAVASSLIVLGRIHYAAAELSDAAACFQRAIAIREKALGPDDILTAHALGNMAVVLLRRGDSAGAEPILERVLSIRMKVLGDSDPEVASAMNSLAEVYQGRGDYQRAAPLLEKAVAIQEAVAASPTASPEEILTLARFLNNLGRLYRARADLQAAEAPFKRSLELREKARKPGHPDIALALNALAALYQERGDLKAAEPLYTRALTIYEASFGPDNLNVAAAVNNLAVLYLLEGALDKAGPLYMRALTIRERALGPRHPDVATTLASIAVFYQRIGDVANAIDAQRRSVDIRDANATLILATGSEQQKLQYMDTLQESTDITLSLRRQFDTSVPAADLAVTTVLRRKGRVLDAMVDTTANVRRGLDPEGQKLMDGLSAARAQLAKLTLQPASAGSYEANAKALAAAESDVQDLERQLSRKGATGAGDVQPISIADVQKTIPADAALIEFVSYRPFDPTVSRLLDRFGPPRFAAFVIGHEGQARWLELGAADAIEKRVAAWRAALRSPRRTDVRSLGRAVDEIVMRPIRAAGFAGTRLIVAPDGSLNLIPFAALVDEQDRYLVERYQISYVSSGRDLVRLGEPRRAQRAALVIADPVFGERGATTPQAADRGGQTTPFGPLPGTAAEAAAIAKLLPGAEVKTGTAASEGSVKATHGPNILHIASHGFFFDQGSFSTPTDGRALVMVLDPSAEASAKYPLLRSGLALAGAEIRQGGGGEDGLLTAIEAASLDLSGTHLVVLSACETGVGEVRSGDGVHGLRRAFAMAGAEAVVMSLWAVNDVATKDLMVGYYQRLLAGRGRADGLRDVQLGMLKDQRRSHPFYWASFVTAGNWSAFDPKGR